jgi:opacity protein-like surface antigen
MRRIVIGLGIFIVFALAPVPAGAQTYLAPFVGFNFAGDAGKCPLSVPDCQRSRLTYGAGLGHLSHGLLGIEGEFAYSPHFFGDSPVYGANNVMTFMANLMVAAPLGPVHPYVTGGVGVMASKVEVSLAALNESNTSFAYNLGGGLMVFLPVHLGLRFDLRHVGSVSDFSTGGITVPGLSGQKLNFWRFTIGVAIH